MRVQVPPSSNRSPMDFAQRITWMIHEAIDLGLVHATMDERGEIMVDLSHHPEPGASRHNDTPSRRCKKKKQGPRPDMLGLGWRIKMEQAYRSRAENGNLKRKNGRFIATKKSLSAHRNGDTGRRLISPPRQHNEDLRTWFIACNGSLPTHRNAR